MANEQLRSLLIRRIDSLLSRPLMVWGEDRILLQAVRSYASGMTDADLDRLDSFMRYRGEDMEHEHIAPGDCVTLMSGEGPVMCVTSIDNPEGEAIVNTVWFTCEGLAQSGNFPMTVLQCHHETKKAKAKK